MNQTSNNGSTSNAKATSTATNRIPEATTAKERASIGVPSVADLRAMLAEKRRQLSEYGELVRETECEVETLGQISTSSEGERAILAADLQMARYSFTVATDALQKKAEEITVL